MRSHRLSTAVWAPVLYAWRGARRRPLVSTLAVVVLLASLAGGTVVTAYARGAGPALRTVEVNAARGPVRFSPTELGITVVDGRARVDRDRLGSVVDRVARELLVRPQTGRYELRDDVLLFSPGQTGSELDRGEALRTLHRAALGEEGLTLPMRELMPPDPVAVVVTLKEFRLDLYRGPSILQSYPIGVGRVAYHQHTGAYKVASKAVNPVWWNPGAPWSRGMPRYVPPGPRNPLGSRALRLDRDLLAIHGTPDPSSVGRRASRGCFRMLKADVEELFELVPVGTPVFVANDRYAGGIQS